MVFPGPHCSRSRSPPWSTAAVPGCGVGSGWEPGRDPPASGTEPPPDGPGSLTLMEMINLQRVNWLLEEMDFFSIKETLPNRHRFLKVYLFSVSRCKIICKQISAPRISAGCSAPFRPGSFALIQRTVRRSVKALHGILI